MFVLIAVCMTVSLVTSQSTLKTLNYSLLNSQETITLPLQSYFSNPAAVQVDQQNSTEGITDILELNFTRKPVSEVSSLIMSAHMPDNSTTNFSSLSVLMERSVYNYPNKVFLMDRNILFSVRYRVSGSDSENDSYVQALRIDSSVPCTQMAVQQFNTSQYLIVACLHSINGSGNISLYPFKFLQPQPGFLSELFPLQKLNVSLPGCERLLLHSFQAPELQKSIGGRVLLGCAQSKSNLNLFLLTMINNKGVYSLLADSFINDVLAFCIKDSQQLLDYQKGLLALTDTTLRYFTYDLVTRSASCTTNFLNISGREFVVSVRDRDIQYIYVVFQDRIMVKQSFSPNNQIVSIISPQVINMQVVSCCVARRFMGLLYRNATDYCLLTFDLRTSYPKLVDTVLYAHNSTFINFYSVSNFLEQGNYFIIYDSFDNTLNLNYYTGYEFALTIGNSSLAVGTITLVLKTQTQSLKLSLVFRDFDDLTLEKSSKIEEILAFQDVLTLNLTNYISGPLGRFYNYPNHLSVFQYVNYETQISVEQQLKLVKQSLIAFAINNLMSKPLINFYFAIKSILTCELDFKEAQRRAALSQCKTSKVKSTLLTLKDDDSTKKVVVLAQQKFLQFSGKVIELCEMVMSGEYDCSPLSIVFLSTITKVQVVKYSFSNIEQSIELIANGKKEVVYCMLERRYPVKVFTIYIYYHVQKENLPDLVKMSITELLTDSEYIHFLVLRLKSDDDSFQKVVVYDRPYIRTNSTSTLIGHVIEAFQHLQLEALFCFNNLLVLVTQQYGIFKIREYKITKEYRLRFVRAYPLYNYQITVGGRHTQDQNFMYIQVLDQNYPYFLVYSPFLPPCNVLSHKLFIRSPSPLFAQQIQGLGNSSMLLDGTQLVGLTFPNLIFRFEPVRVPTMTLWSLNVSVVDSLNEMSILNYQFAYNEKEEKIDYLNSQEIKIQLDNLHTYTTLTLNANNIYGIVQDYNFTLPETHDCSLLKIQHLDVFTKQQCLQYYQSQDYGTLNDFVALEVDGLEIEVLVTDTSLFCVRNRILSRTPTASLNNLTDCRLETFAQTILLTCIKTTTLARAIFNLTLFQTITECKIVISPLFIPDPLAFQDFDIQFTGGFIVFQVPIRQERNKIYYKTQYLNNTISGNYSLIVRRQQNELYQSQFSSADSSLGQELFLLLQDGIGIYNISDRNATVAPALWLTSSQLVKVVGSTSFAYLKYLQLDTNSSTHRLLVQLGTEWRSYELQILFKVNNSSSILQTIYDLVDLETVFEYKQYLNCKNGVFSQSQRFQDLLVKVCSYQPISQNVFANFISINKQTPDSLIQFYKRSGSSSFPFRIDVIYSNPASNHEFAIRDSTLVVGSRFNLLCYYQLTPNVSWTLTRINTTQDKDLECTATLTLYNRHNSLSRTVKIQYDDGDDFDPNYWVVPAYYIQRGFLLLILVNTLRLLLDKCRRTGRTRRKESNRLHSSRFQVMVKINSKKSI